MCHSRQRWIARAVSCAVVTAVILAAFVVPAAADPITCTWTVAVGDSPCAIAVNETTGTVYVANRDSDNVTVIDSEGVTTTVEVGGYPNAIAVNETTGKAYVANYESDSVTVIDAAGSTDTIDVGGKQFGVQELVTAKM